MNTKSTLFDDMHPRSFPKSKKQLGKNTALVPKPNLPGVAIIADKNKLPKPAPKKSFTKWKQQHEALFKPMNFQTTSHPNSYSNKGTSTFQSNSGASSKFELGANTQKCNEQQCQHYESDSKKFKKTVPGNANKPEFQNMITFSQLNRIARSEAIRVTIPVEEQQALNQYQDFQSNPCGCHYSTPSHQLTYPSQGNAFENKQELHLDKACDLSLVKPSKENEKKSKGPLTDTTLVNIVEEQIEIVKQQKQILMQQNEIFSLQYQIEKLLLTNSNSKTTSLTKGKQIAPTAGVKPKALPMVNGTPNNPNTSPVTRKSIGLMTSFNGNLNDSSSPNEHSNQRSASGKDSHKDTMLERINKIIKNSPPMINYRMDKENMNCRISPNRADLNISSQTLIYKTSNKDNVSMNELKIADRSFALHCLDMKYRPQMSSSPNTQRLSPSPRHDTVGKTRCLPTKDTDNDYVNLNISPDKSRYDPYRVLRSECKQFFGGHISHHQFVRIRINCI